MSIDWFRSWHGAPTDSKWLLIAKRAGVSAGVVSAVVWALFDHASQATPRGNVETFDVETYSVFSGFSEDDITGVIDAMKEKKLINTGTLSAWEKRQPKREDHSTERVHKHRNTTKRTETQRNTTKRQSRVEKNRLEEDTESKEYSEAKASGADAPIDHRKRLFDEGLKKLARLTGKGPDACRSFVGKCLKAASDDAVTVLGLIEDAERNQVVDPSAWIAARLKNATGPPVSSKPMTEFQRKQAQTNDIRAQLRNYANGVSGSGTSDRLLSFDNSGRPDDLHDGPSATVLEIPGASGRGSG